MTAIEKMPHKTVWIPVKDLHIRWKNCQRPLNQKRADKIGAELDPDMFGILSVTKPNGAGKHHVCDGWTRRTAVFDLWGPNEQVPCNVFDVDTAAEAARIFDVINTGRKPPQPIDVYKVRVTAGTEPEASVNKIIVSLGYHVDTNKTDGALGAVSSCVTVYRKFGADSLKCALIVIQGAWGKSYGSVDGYLIRGFATFLQKYTGQIDVDRLADRVAKSGTPGSIIGRAQTARDLFRGGMDRNVCRVLVGIYNHNLRHDRIEE